MKIAILGTRGVPANYGGFETLAEELGARLAERGHSVTVYGRSQWIKYGGAHYRGIRVRLLPTIRHKYLDTVFHTFISMLHALFQPYGVILMCNAANSIFCLPLRLFGKKVALNVDGIERKRKKWGFAGRLWYLLGELLAVRFPNRIVSDALVIQRYYAERYGAASTFIAYGADGTRAKTREALDRPDLKGNDYVLFVTRLEPENNPLILVKAFEKVKTSLKLVIVGHAPYADAYIRELKKTNDPRIMFPGGIYGAGYRELQTNAYLYVQASEVGGCHPSLIEAMGFGNCVVVNDTPENRETIGDAGVVYGFNDTDDLAEKLQYLIDNPREVERLAALSARRARAVYNWEHIADQYEKIFKEIARVK